MSIHEAPHETITRLTAELEAAREKVKEADQQIDVLLTETRVLKDDNARLHQLVREAFIEGYQVADDYDSSDANIEKIWNGSQTRREVEAV